MGRTGGKHVNKPVRSKGAKAALIVLWVVVGLAVVLGGTALALFLGVGDVHNQQAPELSLDALPESTGEDGAAANDEILDSYTVRRGGKLYSFNKEVVSILLLGVDSDKPEASDGSCNVDAYTDVIIVAAVDLKNNKVSFISFSRDTMCSFETLDSDGNSSGEAIGQLALPFSYGDGGLKSCALTADAVSGLMSGLPIYSCAALYLDGLGEINDVVGGVTVTVLEGLNYGYSSMQPGAEVTLNGDMARAYIQTREMTEEGNLKRMERQKQYFMALLGKTLSVVRQNISSVPELYSVVSDYTVTDMSLSDIVYMASKVVNMSISTDILNVPGTVTLSDDNHVEYRVDESALLDIILQVYYEEQD